MIFISKYKNLTSNNLKIIFSIITLFAISTNSIANETDINALIKNAKLIESSSDRPKLTPTPVGIAGDNNRFGYSISISDNRAVIGAPNMGTTGLAYVYDYDGNDWQQTYVLSPSENLDVSSLFGISVSMENNRIVVGASQSINSIGSTSGSVHVFDLVEGEWVQTQKLITNDGWSIDNFGHSVSLDNNRIAIGAYRARGISNDNSGVVYIFDLISGKWIENQKISPENGRNSDYFGYSVDLSGNRLIIGAYREEDTGLSNNGAAYIYDLDNGIWLLTQKITASIMNNNDYFGFSVSLDGDQALVGAIGNDDTTVDAGSAYVFNFDGDNWTQSTILYPSGNDPSNFGASVKLHNNQAFIGATNHNFNDVNSGSLFVFDFDNGNWQHNQIIHPDSRMPQDIFGFAVSASDTNLFVNSLYDDDNGINSGTVYTYKKVNGSWFQDYELTSNEIDGSTYDSFGSSVSYNGNRLVVGAIYDNGEFKDSGAAYIYDLIENSWVLTQKITANIEIEDGYFGASVSLYGDRLLIGAPKGRYISTEGIGSAYIFELVKGEWIQIQKLNASDGKPNNKFGFSVSLFQDRALVGAYGNDGTNKGSAYIFDLNTNEWLETQKLVPIESKFTEDFGYSVSLNNNRALIGSPSDFNGYPSSFGFYREGAAYVFELVEDSWEQTQKIFDSYEESNRIYAQFGSSVSLFNNRAAIGARSDNLYGSNSSYPIGSASIFDFNGSEWNFTQKLFAQDSGHYDNFGASISLYENKFVVGAFRNGYLNYLTGAAYVFELVDENWIQLLKLKANHTNQYDYFGDSVSLFEDKVFIGASGDDNESGKNAGAVYQYEAHEMIFMNGFEE